MLNLNVNLIILIIASLSGVNCSLSNPADHEQFILRDHPVHRRIKRENRKNVSCIVPAKSSDRVFEVYDADDQPIKNLQQGSLVSKFSHIKFRCSEEYLLPDGGNEYTTYCNSQGEWDPLLKSCLRVCPALKISNVDLTCTIKYQGIDCNGPLPTDAQVTARCKDHYHWIPESNPTYEYEYIRCRDNGQWNKELRRCGPDCGIPKQELLVADGLEAKFGDFPWHIALYYLPHPKGPLLICGGTLITTNVILTAAHCFYYERNGVMRKDPKDYTIVVAKMTRNYTNSDNPMQREYKVSEIIFYEREYNPIKGYSYDIAILVLTENVAISSYVLPACSPGPGQRGFNPKTNKQGILAGFGRDEKNALPEGLKFARLNFTDSKECLKRIPGEGLPPDKFCAGESKGPKPLKGDSGGGYIFKEGSLYYIRGIVSTKIDSSDGPVITFTDVAYYQDWIDTVIQQYLEQNATPSSTPMSTTTTSIQKSTKTITETPTKTSRPTSSQQSTGQVVFPTNNKKKVCPKLQSTNVDLTCTDERQKIIDCNRPLLSGTQVTAKCKPLHHPISGSDSHHNSSVRCQNDGKWNKELFKCDTDCGVPVQQTLIANGVEAPFGKLPWHVAIYSIRRGYLLICGGTLITKNVVLSAAHCFYNESASEPSKKPEDYIIAVGKMTRNYNHIDNHLQKNYAISKILYAKKEYNSRRNGYSSDIAIIILKENVTVSPYVLPACFSRDSRLGFSPEMNELGIVAGWGLDENREISEPLKLAELKFIDYNQCTESIPGLTYDKFCAGADKGGPRLMVGDSGGGLVFRKGSLYYVRGIVSTSERFTETPISAFTDLSYFQDDIVSIIEQRSGNVL